MSLRITPVASNVVKLEVLSLFTNEVTLSLRVAAADQGRLNINRTDIQKKLIVSKWDNLTLTPVFKAGTIQLSCKEPEETTEK